MGTYTISLKGDTTGNWEASDRVLVKNEVGVERDDNDNVIGIKIGDGTNGWNSLGYVYGQYSETPVRVGTWIDGTPIWRMAFELDYADLERENDILYSDIGLSFKDDTYVFVLNELCVAKVKNYPNPNFPGDEVPRYSQGNYDPQLFYIAEMDVGVINEIKTYGAIFYGYIEFVTDEENIIIL